MGLNDSFMNIQGTILNTKPMPSVVEAFSMVVSDESQREINTNEPASYVVHRDFQKSGKSQKQYQSDSKTFEDKPTPKCTNYRKVGHNIDNCYWINDFPSTHALHRVQLKTSRNNPNIINNIEKHS